MALNNKKHNREEQNLELLTRRRKPRRIFPSPSSTCLNSEATRIRQGISKTLAQMEATHRIIPSSNPLQAPSITATPLANDSMAPHLDSNCSLKDSLDATRRACATTEQQPRTPPITIPPGNSAGPSHSDMYSSSASDFAAVRAHIQTIVSAALDMHPLWKTASGEFHDPTLEQLRTRAEGVLQELSDMNSK